MFEHSNLAMTKQYRVRFLPQGGDSLVEIARCSRGAKRSSGCTHSRVRIRLSLLAHALPCGRCDESGPPIEGLLEYTLKRKEGRPCRAGCLTELDHLLAQADIGHMGNQGMLSHSETRQRIAP